jgi:uncharacterized protein YfkK (UPF0435 family)
MVDYNEKPLPEKINAKSREAYKPSGDFDPHTTHKLDYTEKPL